MSHEGMGKHACWRAHPSDSMHRRDEWIKSSLRVSDLKAALHQFVTAQRRRRHSCQRRTTSCFSAKSFKRRSWTHRRRSLRAVYATWSGRHGRTSATSARDALGSDAKVRPVVRSPPPWAGPRRGSRGRPRCPDGPPARGAAASRAGPTGGTRTVVAILCEPQTGTSSGASRPYPSFPQIIPMQYFG
jgi:hypothetical protein